MENCLDEKQKADLYNYKFFWCFQEGFLGRWQHNMQCSSNTPKEQDGDAIRPNATLDLVERIHNPFLN